jgi:hypothetical protein
VIEKSKVEFLNVVRFKKRVHVEINKFASIAPRETSTLTPPVYTSDVKE